MCLALETDAACLLECFEELRVGHLHRKLKERDTRLCREMAEALRNLRTVTMLISKNLALSP